MKIENNGKTLIADEGKIFKCICHNAILGSKVFLKEIMKDGVLVTDSPENYIEIDEPENLRQRKTINGSE